MLVVQIAAGIVLGVVILVLLWSAVHEARGNPVVFWGLVAVYGVVAVAIWWGLRFLGII